LWGDVSTRLDDVGFWPALQRADPHGGIVILPILVALFVPSLETVTAFFLIAVPPAMLVLLVTRSPFFPKIFAMLSVCQVGLVLAGVIGADSQTPAYYAKREDSGLVVTIPAYLYSRLDVRRDDLVPTTPSVPPAAPPTPAATE
jgi:hypothetical protein